MSEIAILGTGLIYRNPKPHLHAVHAYFPSVVQLTNGELLCSLVLGEAFDAENCHTYVARSADRGETWRLQGRIYPGTTDRITSDATRAHGVGRRRRGSLHDSCRPEYAPG